MKSSSALALVVVSFATVALAQAKPDPLDGGTSDVKRGTTWSFGKLPLGSFPAKSPVFVAAQPEVLDKTLVYDGWQNLRSAAIGVQSFQRPGPSPQRVDWEKAKVRVRGLPLWWADVSPEEQPAMVQTFNQAISQVHHAIDPDGGTTPLIEVRHPPGDAAGIPDGGFPVPAVLRSDPVLKGSPRGSRLALTFDACSTLDRAGYDERIVKILIERRVPATLFISGFWAQTHPAQTRALGADPLFEIANHSFVHPHMTTVSAVRQRDELLWTQEILRSLTGTAPRLFRPPFGEWDRGLLEQAARVGLTTIEYDLPSGDPDPSASADRLVAWVLGRAEAGSIVVMHLNGRGVHTAEALPRIIDGLRAKGFVLSKVGEMLQ